MKRIVSILAGFLAALSAVLPAVPAEAVHTSASAAVLMDAGSGEVLYAENADAMLPIASITKLMTALVVAETHPDWSETVEILPEYTRAEGSSIYLKEGEHISLEALIYGMLLESGNDAAMAVAGHCAGDTGTFVQWMNDRAESLDMEHSHFCNPSGLSEETHYSSARDMALLAKACLENELLRPVLQTKRVTMGERSFVNHNRLLWRYEGCIGLKTGYTEAAGRTLVSAAERDGVTLIAVTLRDGNDWADHAALFDYGFSHWHSETPAQAGERAMTLPVQGSVVHFVDLQYAKTVSFLCREGDTVRQEFNVPDRVQAPVKQGAIAGKAQFFRNDELVAETYLLYGKTVPSLLQHTGILERAKRFLSGAGKGSLNAFFPEQSAAETLRLRQRVKSASQSSPPAGGEGHRIIFGGGVYVDENTDQAASVGIVRKWRTMHARSRLRSFCRKNKVFSTVYIKGRKRRGGTASEDPVRLWRLFPADGGAVDHSGPRYGERTHRCAGGESRPGAGRNLSGRNAGEPKAGDRLSHAE